MHFDNTIETTATERRGPVLDVLRGLLSEGRDETVLALFRKLVATLADQVTWGTDLLRPLWRAALVGALNAKVMHLDGTGLVVLDRDAPGGKKLGTLWGYNSRCSAPGVATNAAERRSPSGKTTASATAE